MRRKKKKLTILIVPLLWIAVPIGLFLFYADKIYPGVQVRDVYLGGKTVEKALEALKGELGTATLTLRHSSPDEPKNFTLNSSDVGFEFDTQKTVERAFLVGRSGSFLADSEDMISLAFKDGVEIDTQIKIDEEKLDEFVANVAGHVTVEPVAASAKIINKRVVIEPGKKGYELPIERLKNEIVETFKKREIATIDIVTEEVDPTLDEAEIASFEARATGIVGDNLTITTDDKEVTLRDSDLVSFIWPEGGYDLVSLDNYIEKIRDDIEREPQDAKFIFEEGRVKEFAPSKDGITLRKQELTREILQALEQLEAPDVASLTVTAPVNRTQPVVKNEEVNSLGIKERVGLGKSRFRGSIASRVHNVALAASRINGVLIAPGETFSFNSALGDVSKLTGYREAYVIQDGKTVLGDGGGVCQVSTTLFRAVLNAGLPVLERRGHSYRVGYYEQDSAPGLDATVYSPTTDFKFKNDTPAHILIQAIIDTKTMSLGFELYGTTDGRVATITKPVLSDVVAPPEDLYQDDPTLAAGKTKQIEYRASGAKSRFSYEVTRNNEVIYKKTFLTTYRPWQAVYLRGTGPAQ